MDLRPTHSYSNLLMLRSYPILASRLMTRSWLAITTTILLLITLRWVFPERPVDSTGARALLDTGFTLGLLGITLLLAGGIGRKFSTWLNLENLNPLEQAIFGLALGLGLLAYGVLMLSLVGLLQAWAIFLWLLIVGVWSWRECRDIADSIPDWLKSRHLAWLRARLWQKTLLVVMSLILLLTLLQALSPPTDPDGLIDHLQAPKIFLEAGRIYPTPDFVFGNYPFTVEFLFTIGLAFGSDTFAKLIHLTYAVLLVLSTFALGQRYISSAGGWAAATVLMGMPIFPVWAGLAYIDMGWTLYEFLGVYAILLWAEHRQQRWLVVSGIMIGLALGSKYLAFAGAAAIGLWILWHTRTRGWRTMFISGALFGGVALAVGSPWFIKNWWWLGNPVFPFFFGNDATTKLSIHNTFTWWDYLLVPWHLYFDRERFVGVYGTIEFPSLLFPLVLLLPWVHRAKALNWLVGLTLLRYIFWLLISHSRFRYMLPVLPSLSILVSGVIIGLIGLPFLQRWSRILVSGMIGGMLMATLCYSLIFFFDVQPLGVLVGWESKDSFLRREVSDYSAKQFIQTNLPNEARVFMMWNARGYYCDDRCIPDLNQRQWMEMVLSSESVPSVAAHLRAMGVTHLLLSVEDVDYRLIQKTSKPHYKAVEFFQDEFRPACAKEFYRDDWTTLYEFTCR